jgi:thioredoxin-dependent peroxiredoxin
MSLKIGDTIPDISATNESGQTIKLAAFRGKKLAIFFYPADMTPGCTAEVCNLRDNYSALKAAGFELLGVSTDSESKHQRFIEKYDLPFSLLADTDKKIVNAFGVFGPKTFMGKMFEGTHRKTFVINEEGEIIHIIDKVKTKDHAAQILDEVKV